VEEAVALADFAIEKPPRPLRNQPVAGQKRLPRATHLMTQPV
jgi:hypothetical protein